MKLRSCAGQSLVLCALLGGIGSLGGCGSDGKSSGQGSDAGAPAPSVDKDPVLTGRWQPLTFGQKTDGQSAGLSVAIENGNAHILYARKTGQATYYIVDPQGGQTEVSFPPSTKGAPRVTISPDGASQIVVMNSPVESFFRAAGATTTTMGPQPDPSWFRSPLAVDVVSDQGAPVLASFSTKGSEMVTRVEKLGAAGWTEIGAFPEKETLSRIRLASNGDTLALATLTGAGKSLIRIRRGGTWRELDPVPLTGAAGIMELVVDGTDLYFLAYDESQTSTLWRHDGNQWTAWAKSAAQECFHSLVRHNGAFYTFYGDLPNKRPLTRGYARIDKNGVHRVALNSQVEPTNIDPDSRHDEMDYEWSEFISRDGQLWLFYEEGYQRGGLRVYKLVPR